MGNVAILAPKQSGATRYYSVDFTSLLAEGESVGSGSVLAATLYGTDAFPSLLLSGSPTVSGNTLTQLVTGGVPGVVYCLRFQANTNQSNFLISLGNLSVQSPDIYGS